MDGLTKFLVYYCDAIEENSWHNLYCFDVNGEEYLLYLYPDGTGEVVTDCNTFTFSLDSMHLNEPFMNFLCQARRRQN